MIMMGDSGSNGQQRGRQWQHNCIWKQQWRLIWQRARNAIVMAIAMNAGSGNGRRQWWWHNLKGEWRWQHNGWQDGGVIAMAIDNGREKATQWKTAMTAAQLQWAMAMAAQQMALYLDKLLSPPNIIDRLNVIPWWHGTHDKVWDTTTITSLRKVEVEEEVKEKVEV
jgi:hypothetical protein